MSVQRQARLACVLAALVLPATEVPAGETAIGPGPESGLDPGMSFVTRDPLDWCDYRSPAERLAQRRTAFARGDLREPVTRRQRTVRSAGPIDVNPFPNGNACLGPEDLYRFEDTDQVLLGDYTFAELEALMTDAANALLAEHGDRYDYIAFWLNYMPSSISGIAFYDPLANDIQGLGDPSTFGAPLFDSRTEMGLNSARTDGYVMLFDVNAPWWVPGTTGTDQRATRLSILHEFEHRWALFLPELGEDLRLQGGGPVPGCGREFHWNWRVDGQGSAMEIADWVGSDPAQPDRTFINFNTDIGGGFSYTDLYLMGYVSPQEMDAGNSELRYMQEATACTEDYPGPIMTLTSADIIGVAGPRIPDATQSQKHHRVGWIMIHLPGDPPAFADVDPALKMMRQHQTDWFNGTLGRGSINSQLVDDCDCDNNSDDLEISAGVARDTNGNRLPDACELNCGNPDCDEDAVVDTLDNCILLANADQNDADTDEVGDACDNCPADPNTSQVDRDADRVGDACDNCPAAANPDQSPAVLGQTFRARRPDEFCWQLTSDVRMVRGDLADVATLQTGAVTAFADAVCFSDPDEPLAGAGFFYLVQPDCAAASWQSTPGAEPARDAQISRAGLLQ